MPATVPFRPSVNNLRLGVTLDGVRYLFDNIHWNSRDQAWYFDLREEDETLILAGFKVVLNTRLTSTSTNQFFQKFIFDVFETSGTKLDAKYDDLGARVRLLVTSSKDVIKTQV